MPDVAHSALTGANLHEPKGADSAAVDTVPVSDGAGATTWRKAAADEVTVADAGGHFVGTEVEAALQELGPAIGAISIKYGEMGFTANGTATTITLTNTYYQVVAGWANEHSDGLTFSTDHLELDTASDGIYYIICTLSFTGQTNETFRFEFHHDIGAGYVPIGEGAISRKTANTDVGAVALMAVDSLDATDKIALFVQNVGGTGNPTITDANFFLYRLVSE